MATEVGYGQIIQMTCFKATFRVGGQDALLKILHCLVARLGHRHVVQVRVQRVGCSAAVVEPVTGNSERRTKLFLQHALQSK